MARLHYDNNSVREFLDPDPDDFQNVVVISLTKDTSSGKISRISDQQFLRSVGNNRQTNKEMNTS